jgi:glycosyltransferase involved in cell wall biosynthesis
VTVRTSIVVPSRGGRDRLPVLLDGLARQTDTDLEVVVVVDGDVDDTEGLLARRTDLDLRTVVFPENRGRSAALNAGFAAARGEILVRMDDDLEPEPSYVAGQVAGHAGESHGVVGLCRNVYPDTAYATVYGTPMDLLSREAAYATGPDRTWLHWGANVSVTRDDFERVGGYDEGYRRYGWEDVDWGYRLHRLGRPVVVLPGLEVAHHVAATTTTVRAVRAYHSGFSLVRFQDKHGVTVVDHERPPGSTWERVVARYAARLDEDRVRRRGDRIESELLRLPRYVARKRVALLVESAARAGYHEARRQARPEESPT